MSQVAGKNVILYVQSEEESITVNVVNMNGTQTVTVTWGTKPAGTLITLIGYNDGTWHDTPVVGTSTSNITITTGSYTYRLVFKRTPPLPDITYSPLPATFLVWKPFACSRTVSINFVTEMIETSVSGTGVWRTYKPTANSWGGNLEGVVNLQESGRLSIEDLRQKQFSQELLYIKYERTDDDGNQYNEYGYGYITSSEDTGNYNDMNTFSLEIRGTGEIQQSES